METKSILSLRHMDRDMRQNAMIVGILLLIIIVFTIMSPNFFSSSNFMSVLLNAMPVAIIAVAESICITGRYFDMSVGMVASIGGCLSAYMSFYLEMPVMVCILAALAVGLVSGTISGLSVSRLGMNAFITTFALTEVYRGIIFLWTGGVPFTVVGKPDYVFLGQTKLFDALQLPILFLLLIYLAMALFMRYTRLGRSVYLIGNNPMASHICGINVKNVQMFMFILSGVLASFAGLMFAMRTATAQPFVGQNYAFEAIAASIIGGTSMAGGKSNLAMVFIGVMIVYLVKNGLVMVGLPDFYQYVAVGIIVFLGVLLQIQTRRETV